MGEGLRSNPKGLGSCEAGRERGMKGPWNLGVKVKDLDADLAFLEACGATQIQKGTIPRPEGDAPFGMAFLGPQRLLLFPHVIYEDTLAEPLKSGLTGGMLAPDAKLAAVVRCCDQSAHTVGYPASRPDASEYTVCAKIAIGGRSTSSHS